MKLNVLVDNNTYIDRYFLGEPGLSFFIEENGIRILFDCGYSNIFLSNAQKMGIDLLNLDHLVFSHSHMDHTWGVDSLMREYNNAVIESQPHKRPVVTAHPKAFESTSVPGIGEISSHISREKLGYHFDLNLTESPVNLTSRLLFLGYIPRKNDFEALKPIGWKTVSGKDDFIPDDTAMAYKSSEGLVIITGCSHAGICNIVEHAKDVCNEDRVLDIIGGFHLLNPSEKQMQGTVEYLSSLNLKKIHPCHCTDLNSKLRLGARLPIKEVGVGLSLEYI